MEEVTAAGPAAPPDPPTPPPAWLSRGALTILVVGATVPSDLLHMYLSTFRRIEPVAVGFALIAWLVSNMVMFLPWSGLWALVSRLVRQESHFLGHLNTVLLAQLLWTFVRDALGLTTFAASLDASVLMPAYLLAWAALSLVLGTHLRFVSTAPPRRLLAWGGLASGVLVGLACMAHLLIVRRAPGARLASVTLLPHRLLLRSPAPIAGHVAALEQLQTSVDSRAKEQ